MNSSLMFHYIKLNYSGDLNTIQIYIIINAPSKIIINENEVKENYDHYIYSKCTNDMKKRNKK